MNETAEQKEAIEAFNRELLGLKDKMGGSVAYIVKILNETQFNSNQLLVIISLEKQISIFLKDCSARLMASFMSSGDTSSKAEKRVRKMIEGARIDFHTMHSNFKKPRVEARTE